MSFFIQKQDKCFGDVVSLYWDGKKWGWSSFNARKYQSKEVAEVTLKRIVARQNLDIRDCEIIEVID